MLNTITSACHLLWNTNRLKISPQLPIPLPLSGVLTYAVTVILMLILFLEELIFYPFLFHYLQKKVLKMKSNCFHFLVSFTFTSKYIELEQKKFSYGKNLELSTS